MTRRSRIAGFGGSGLLVLAGIVCVVVFGGTLGQVLAFILIAAGLVLATSLVFLEVGLSEDHARERERLRARERERRPPASDADRPTRLPRLRGERRRLK
jgi:hypothetical protein